ncbi:protamine-2 (modular protein) [Mesorhizobium sp. CC13]|uniref:protamine-2 (modular protein) n=1 Tax=Mesorhizobium sp. CC13 TaxID=3029194 RepID=UPI003263582D
MDRRLFLMGVLGLAGAAAATSMVRPAYAMPGIPGARRGILDELEAPDAEVIDDEDWADIEPVRHRGRRRRRRRRRRAWRRLCRRYWRYGRRVRRCYRRRVWVWYWVWW